MPATMAVRGSITEQFCPENTTSKKTTRLTTKTTELPNGFQVQFFELKN